MPRPRKNKDDAWMPPRVYLGRSAYEYHPKGGGNIRLCDKTSTQAQVWSAWEALMNDRPDYSMLEGLIERFFKSGEFFELAPETQKDYRKYSKKLLMYLGKCRRTLSNLNIFGVIWTSGE